MLQQEIGIWITLFIVCYSFSSARGNNATRNAINMREGIARDLKTAASEIEKAASEMESQMDSETAASSSTHSDGIDHEDGNIPFEWRVQLIHRRFGDSWNNRHKAETRQGNGYNENAFDRYKDLAAYGQLRERYRKKKIDILIEEWWNKEKWNRFAWDDSKPSLRESDEYEHGTKYSGSGRRNHHHHSAGNSKYRPVDEVMEYQTGHASTPVRGYAKSHRRRKLRPRLVRKRPYYAESTQQKLLLSTLDGRPACARVKNDFCEKDPDYPENIVTALIKSNLSNFRDLIHSARSQWRRSGYGTNKEVNSVVRSPAVCFGQVTKAKPLWAPNYSGKWKLIVNIPNYSQTYLADRCSLQTFTCASVNNMSCRQSYGSLPLVALDLTRDQRLHVDWFALPFACSCRPIINQE